MLVCQWAHTPDEIERRPGSLILLEVESVHDSLVLPSNDSVRALLCDVVLWSVEWLWCDTLVLVSYSHDAIACSSSHRVDLR